MWFINSISSNSISRERIFHYSLFISIITTISLLLYVGAKKNCHATGNVLVWPLMHPNYVTGRSIIGKNITVQFSRTSVQSVQSLSRVRLCDPMNRSTPGLPVHHQLPEFTQTPVHRVSDAIQPSHLLSSPSPPVPNPSQHQSLFQ